MTPSRLSPATGISPTSSLVAEPLRGTGGQRGEPAGSSCERADHKQAVGRDRFRPRSPGPPRPEDGISLAVAALLWARPEGPRQRFPMPAAGLQEIFRRNHGEGRGRAACRRPTRGRRVTTARDGGGRVKGGRRPVRRTAKRP